MSNNIYDILEKIKSLETPKHTLTEGKKAKPDYIDIDKDGDKKEPMKKAAKDKAKGGMAEAVARVEKNLSEKYMGFKKTVAAIKKGGSAENPEAVAAAIGRKKYGKEKFQKAAAAGKKLGEENVNEGLLGFGARAIAPGYGAADTVTRASDDDWVGAGMSSVATGLGMIPTVPTQAASFGIDAINVLRDAAKRAGGWSNLAKNIASSRDEFEHMNIIPEDFHLLDELDRSGQLNEEGIITKLLTKWGPEGIEWLTKKFGRGQADDLASSASRRIEPQAGVDKPKVDYDLPPSVRKEMEKKRAEAERVTAGPEKKPYSQPVDLERELAKREADKVAAAEKAAAEKAAAEKAATDAAAAERAAAEPKPEAPSVFKDEPSKPGLARQVATGLAKGTAKIGAVGAGADVLRHKWLDPDSPTWGTAIGRTGTDVKDTLWNIFKSTPEFVKDVATGAIETPPKGPSWEERAKKGRLPSDEISKPKNEGMLSPKQKKIASMAGNPNKIDAEDFAALRSQKKTPVKESGLMYHAGVKKHGVDYMKKAAELGRKGASQEELGRLKDKYSKAYKNKKMDEDSYNEDMLSPKEKSFAALAEPKDKITYADRIAGAKKKQKDEGNAFSGALDAARDAGASEFKVDGKTYKVKEDNDDFLGGDDPVDQRGDLRLSPSGAAKVQQHPSYDPNMSANAQYGKHFDDRGYQRMTHDQAVQVGKHPNYNPNLPANAQWNLLNKQSNMQAMKEGRTSMREGWEEMQKYLEKKRGPESKGGAGKKAGTRYGGSAQRDDDEEIDGEGQPTVKKKGRPKGTGGGAKFSFKKPKD